MKIISLFSGCGGLDLGFENAGFRVVWANEFDKAIWDTYRANFPHTELCTKDMRDIASGEMPNAIGVIGGPPCQSWSEAGALRGINDERGQLFFEFVRVLKDKHPLFFLAENVSGMLFKRHNEAVQRILAHFENLGYRVSYALLNAKYYGVPQDRKRVIFVGYYKNIGKQFEFPAEWSEILTLKDAIWDIRGNAKPAKDGNKTNSGKLKVPNHEYMVGGFSPIFMSRNRKRNWNEPSFTIQAGGRHAPLHPAAKPMVKLGKDKWEFDATTNYPYRRLSVRECARIQTFPDSFSFKYQSIADGYKMIGNAVPVKLAEAIAKKIWRDVEPHANGRHIFQKTAKPGNVADKIPQYQT